MACNKRKRTLPSTSSMKILFCLGASSHAVINTGPSPTCCFAFSPSQSIAIPATRVSALSRRGLSRSALSALPRSSTTGTQQQTSSTEDDLFFAQDLDGQSIESYGANQGGEYANQMMESNINGNSGGMDAYAQQVQDYSAAQVEEVRLESPSPEAYQSSSTSVSSAAEAAKFSSASSQEFNDNQPISSVDARVLESILQEGKLDLSTEAEVKKILEGPRLQEGEEYPTDEEGDGKYSSKFVGAVSDNKFWNSLRAKANEIIDSVGIYIENRIERDSQTLAAVGIFTLDRIRRDISRALPAAGRATRKLLLATNSSYAERLLDVTDKTPFALPAERSVTNREMLDGYDDLYDELTTPADEIRQVTEAIRDILSGKDIPPDSSPGSRRGVRSFAPAGTSRMAERQRRAYRARKQTVLKREKEGIDRKLGRAIGSVSDATWEFRREMQTDAGREAGYRSKGVRSALAAGATQLLEAGRESSRRLLSGERRRSMISGDTGGVEIVDDVVGSTSFVDVTPLEEEEIIADVIEETNMEYAPDGLLSPQSFVEEKRRLISSLESCLSQPSETWLTKEVVAQASESGITLDNTVLRDVITTMVTLRDQLQQEMDEILAEQVDLKIEYVAMELRRMKQMLDSLCDVAISAAGEQAAYLLKEELEGFVLSDSLDDIVEIELERMEQLLAEMVAAREEEIQARKRQYAKEAAAASAVATEVVDVDRGTTSVGTGSAGYSRGGYTEVEVLSSQGSQDQYQATTPDSRVELVSDTEYSEYEQQFKSAQSVDAMGYDEVDTAEKEDNPAADFVLRVVDVVFFIGEKFFLVLLPDLITGGARVSGRYAQAQNRGRGTVGWKPLKNVKTKNIR